MFQKGDYVLYGNTGVCLVEDVGRPEGIPVVDKEKVYYKLAPVYGAGTIYIPVTTSVFMRSIMTREEAEELIDGIPRITEDTYNAKDQRLLAEHYRASFETHECRELVRLIKTVYMRNRIMTENGRKPRRTDQQYMKRAEELLHGELSVALGIPYEEVREYIRREVEEKEEEKAAIEK